MKKKINFIIFVIFICFTKAQTHRFIYDVEYKKDSTSTITTKENFHLDIHKDDVIYYTRDFYTADSLINNNIPFPKDAHFDTSNILLHKKGSNDFQEFDLLENTVLNLKSTDSQNWKLLDDKKQINGLTMQKATTSWGSRNWTAWFSSEIPFQEGPYKFRGLPGLIIEINDDKNNYKISLVKSENITKESKNQFIEMSKQMSVPVSWERFKATKLAYYKSPISFIKNGTGSSATTEFYLNDGTKVNDKNAKEVNERLRNTVKKFNNPIDLTKAIKYN